MQNTQIVVMAAGMGSRFGGLKQIEAFGQNGEALLDFSLYDAQKAGFNRAVIIIKKEIEKEFREACGKRIERFIDVEYAFQETDMLPKGFAAPADRKKPWGTGHAVICAADKITAPFAVINADDYYGAGAYRLIREQLIRSGEICMVGYKLKNTLTENGTVSRGVCGLENGYLKSIKEYTALDKNSGFDGDTVVSMNMWGFTPDILPLLLREFEEFLKTGINSPKAEFYLPAAIDSIMKKDNKKVRVLRTDERWYGVTYKEDKESVKEAMRGLINEGKYIFSDVNIK